MSVQYRSVLKGEFLYSAVFNPHDCSNRLTVYSIADLFNLDFRRGKPRSTPQETTLTVLSMHSFELTCAVILRNNNCFTTLLFLTS